jgi:hypothetical protein
MTRIYRARCERLTVPLIPRTAASHAFTQTDCSSTPSARSSGLPDRTHSTIITVMTDKNRIGAKAAALGATTDRGAQCRPPSPSGAGTGRVPSAGLAEGRSGMRSRGARASGPRKRLPPVPGRGHRKCPRPSAPRGHSSGEAPENRARPGLRKRGGQGPRRRPTSPKDREKGRERRPAGASDRKRSGETAISGGRGADAESISKSQYDTRPLRQWATVSSATTAPACSSA